MAKVLLVEDDNNLREIYEARLLAEGYTINSAKDGEEALVVAKAEKPDLIISDVMMPKISGFEMLDILRNTQGLKETKVIMLTALGQADDRTRADSLGADRYLVKSQVTLEDIVKAAHELLEGDSAPAATPLVTTVTDTAVAVAPEPAAAPAVTAVPVPEMPVSEPTATPVTAPDETATPEAPAAAIPSPTTEPPATTADAQVAEDTEVPAVDSAPEAPTTVEPVVSPETVPADSSETPAPAADVPPSPEVDAVAPAAAATPEVTETAPEAPAAPAVELPASESTADEQATVDNQIEDFIKNNAVEVPPELQTPPPNETTDRVMQESVDTLIASTEHADETAAPEGQAEDTTPEPTPPVDAPVAPPTNNDEDESSDGVTIAHKKIIQRPSSAEKTDLGELLAREEAKKIVIGDSAPGTATLVQNDTPAAPVEDPAVPPTAPLPGNTFSPTNGTVPPKPNGETDPNSISL
ncbi:MAG: response regulator [Candidatus Saccharimonadales bacterium]